MPPSPTESSVAAKLRDAAAARERGDTNEAMQLLDDLRAQNPSFPTSYLEASNLLRAEKRFDEADAMLALGMAHCSDRLRLTADHALVAHERRDWIGALNRWHLFVREFPQHPNGWLGVGRALLQLDRFDDADQQLSVAVGKFPDNVAIAMTYAELSTKQQDWPAASERWGVANRLNSKNPYISRQLGVARMHAQWDQSAEAHGRVDVPTVEDPETRSLLMTFESLGANCELGLVQRRFEAEPLGLLRWTYVSPIMLIRLLEDEFAGLGLAENISLVRASWREYFVEDATFRLSFHTFVTDDLADEATFLRKQGARLRWLRDKLVSDLRDGSKMFVYKLDDKLAGPYIDRIHRAVKLYNRSDMNGLLYVTLSGADNPAGSVKDCGGGLVRAYVSSFFPGEGGSRDVQFDQWVSICRETNRIRHG